MNTRVFSLPIFLILTASVTPVFAQDTTAEAKDPRALAPRLESNWKLGSERSILMNEFWIPVAQNIDDGSVLYMDARFMADDQDNKEFNLGAGYRNMIETKLVGEGIVGAHVWLDRRITDRGSAFNQVTAGAEWFSKDWEVKVNAYLPLNDSKTYAEGGGGTSSSGTFVGTQIVYQGGGQTIVEESMKGADIEIGYRLPLPDGITDSTRVYGALYHFEGKEAQDVSGWRSRIASDVTPNIQLGARFQKDDVRGSQGFLEATVRLPFGNKKSYEKEGLRARLDESPERDIDIVTNEAVSGNGSSGGSATTIPLLNAVTGTVQRILHVDNTAAGGGDGSAETPFNTLAAAQATAGTNDLIYVHRGDGTTTGQDAGVTLSNSGQMLIGQGSALTFSSGRFTISGGVSVPDTIIAAGSAPVITNTNPNGDGVTVNADNVYLSGFTVDGASRDGILVEGNASSAQNVTITNVTATNNRMGIYIHGTNGGNVSAMVERSATTGNAQHGIAVYDDTAGTFEVDLGGGSLGSAGYNVLAANVLEDLAVEYDGRALSAQNNWWGQASGPDEDAPSVGIRPQIYYGAPINNNLAANWNFDSRWTTNNTAYDRSANANNGTLNNLSLANQVAGQNGEALDFDDATGTEVVVANSASLDISGTQLTMAGWIYPQNLSNGSDEVIFGKAWTDGVFASPYYQYGFEIDTNGGDTFDFIIGDTLGNFQYLHMTNTPAVQNTWQHVVFTYDGANVRGYVNGIERQNWAVTESIQARGDIFRIGSDFQSNQHTDSRLDDLRVYNRALSAAEITQLYQMDTTSTVDTTGFLTAAP